MPDQPRRPPLEPADDASRRRAREQERRRAAGAGARGRDLRRRRLTALAVLVLVAAAVVVLVLQVTSGAGPGGAPTAAATSTGAAHRSAPRRPSSFAVGLRIVHFTDSSRTITLPDGATEPRPLVTEIRYPATGPAGATDVTDAPPARADGPFPLIVFGHGFAVTPALYSRLLQAWARAGFVVAAPVFPLENADAPGGPDESDLANQPADMSFVISQMLAASASAASPFSGLVDPARIAVAGQSDGGDTALAVAYDQAYRDSRVDAAVILSGAEIPGTEGFQFPPGGPPLLATQGTADTVNLPSATNAFFTAALRPKYLLTLPGAEHLPPYSTQQPQLGVVERVTIAFLDGYLDKLAGAPHMIASAAAVPAGVATLTAEP